MKLSPHLWIPALLFVSVAPSQAEDATLTIVKARVQEVVLAPPPPDNRDEQDRLEGVPAPTGGAEWLAKLKIEHVFSGDTSLLGQFVVQDTRDKLPLGNTHPIVPRLKKGEVVIFAVQRLRNGELAPVIFVQPILPEGRLPLVEGRDAGYKKAEERLMGKADDQQPRSDLKTRSSDDRENSTLANSELEAIPNAPLQPSAAQHEELPPLMSKSWLVWLVVVIAATVGAVWVFLLKSK
jgi:hypothetical protein